MKAKLPLTALALALLSSCVVISPHLQHGEYQAWAPHLGLFGIFVLIADVWACFHVWTGHRGLLAKVLWTILIWSCPILGVILFYFFGHEG